MTVLLTRKAVVQVQLETTYDVAATVGLSDGLLVSAPMFSVKPNVLERNFVRNDLSQMPFIIGRKLAGMTFETELRSNGMSNSGLLANSPLIARLFQGCGYVLNAFIGANVDGPYVVGDSPTPVSWDVSSGAFASDTFTAASDFAVGDVVTVGGKAYTFAATQDAIDGHVVHTGTIATDLQNLAAAINRTTPNTGGYSTGMTANAQVSAASTSTTLTATALLEGSVGNAIAASYTPTGASAGAWGTATLAGGVNVASNVDLIEYTLTVTTPGASGAAHVTVTSDTVGESVASAIVTSGTVFSVGTKGLQFTPVFTGSLYAGQQWTAWLRPAGLNLTPVSDNFKSITLAMHKDGVLHTMPGSFGTFEVTAQAGNFAMIKWTFTGTYSGPVDDPNPAPIFETQLPSQVQNARLNMNLFDAVVEKFTFNQGNDIQIRPSVSASDGYVGVRIVSRKPEGGIDPEADLVANNDIWGQMSSAQRMPFGMRVGDQPGNTVWITAPCTQYSGLTYADRNGILVYDAGLRFARVNGDDEVSFYFM